jgi:hypothetical protein
MVTAVCSSIAIPGNAVAARTSRAIVLATAFYDKVDTAALKCEGAGIAVRTGSPLTRIAQTRSPHPNSGLPWFGTISGPSQIYPTWAGEVMPAASPRESFNVIEKRREALRSRL